MSKVWKWILGIVILLMIVAAVVGVIYVLRTHPAVAFAPRNVPFRPNAPSGYGPIMHHRGFGFPFFGGFRLLGRLVELFIFAGSLYFAYWLGKRNARITLDPSPGSGQRPKPAAPMNESDSTPKRGRKVAKSE